MDDANDLIDRLCTAAGMIMEDVSATAILKDPVFTLGRRVAAVAEAGRDIVALAHAADAIARRWR